MTFPLTALGVTLLELEELSEGAVMNVGGVMVFDALPEGGVPSVEEVQALVEDRLSGAARLPAPALGSAHRRLVMAGVDQR